ncbi:uncharacterized protein [Phaseolus vulgaris]|uniref:uncharacterized protein n=1 Tax=Phaseolus vulgaris TaxID=3885 RepID=UPI0035CC4B96
MQVHARSGNSDRAYSSGQFAPPQRPELFPQHNHTSNSNAAWNSSRRRFRDKLGKVEQVLHPKEHKGLQRVSSIEIKTLSAPRQFGKVNSLDPISDYSNHHQRSNVEFSMDDINLYTQIVLTTLTTRKCDLISSYRFMY